MKKEPKKEYKTPAGTVAILVIYILLIIALWATVYGTLLSRGLTQ